jgi:uncharacterized membrane protein
MKLQFFTLTLAAFVGAISFSCSEEDVAQTTSCSGTSVSFANDVKAIIDSKCATNSGCHGAASVNGPGPLTTYTAIAQNKNQISAAINSGAMPKGSSLTSDQKNKILCWIQNGALNN